jgi:hypothetical protein
MAAPAAGGKGRGSGRGEKRRAGGGPNRCASSGIGKPTFIERIPSSSGAQSWRVLFAVSKAVLRGMGHVCFVSICEYRLMNFVEIVLRRRTMEGLTEI